MKLQLLQASAWSDVEYDIDEAEDLAVRLGLWLNLMDDLHYPVQKRLQVDVSAAY